MKKTLFFWVTLASLALAACSSPPRIGAPAPVYGGRTQPGSVVPPQGQPAPVVDEAGGDADVRIAAVRPPPSSQQVVSSAHPQSGRAATSLMARAEQQRASGDLTAAAASLERALRIEPRNAELWNRLAHIREEQKRLDMAAELAAKSNALAGNRDALRYDNWRLIARVRRAGGDTAGARSADQTAARYR